MFNVTVKGNARCNGLIPAVAPGGMAKRGVHAHNNAMSPSRGQPVPDPSKLKFSDRLKAYLSTEGIRSEAVIATATAAKLPDDPYTFSDSDMKPMVVKVNKCTVPDAGRVRDSVKSKLLINSNHYHNQNTVDGGAVKSDVNTNKTMINRLQAQIARNKVTVKHNRHSPERKYDKTYFDKNTKHSIIGLVNNVESSNRLHQNVSGSRRVPVSSKPSPVHLKARRASAKAATPHHEASVQRVPAIHTQWHAPQPYAPLIAPDSDNEREHSPPVYQRHWFCKELELLSATEGHREARLELTRTELKRQLLQMKKSKVGQYRNGDVSPTATSIRRYMFDVIKSLRRKRSPVKCNGTSSTTSKAASSNNVMASKTCGCDGCKKPALPCTKYCVMHIMNNGDQVLFDHCTAKFADNTQCSVPVFDITHELPLCIEHARKRDNYNKMCLETKPKKPRRKIKPFAMIRPQKRNKKCKRSQKNTDLPHTQTTATVIKGSEVTELNVCETSSACESSEEIALGTLSESEFVTIKGDHIGDQDVVEQVLAMQDELVVEHTLVTQASRLLEETDFTNVLNQIPADEFNDLFAVDRNGEYEPSREETEELERALEAVDEDVKSLEKLSVTQGFLDSLLDERTLVESLVQIPDVFHQNSYSGVQCVESPASPHQAATRPLASYHHAALHAVDGMLPVQTQAHAPS